MSIVMPVKLVPVKGAAAAGQRLGQSRVFELLARAGFGARTVTYDVIGTSAVKLAFPLSPLNDARYRRI